MDAPARRRITVRRTVPFDLLGEPAVRLTINDMSSGPDRVLLGRTGAGPDRLDWLAVGDEVQLGPTAWVVDSIVVGDRGSVVLVGGEP